MSIKFCTCLILPLISNKSIADPFKMYWRYFGVYSKLSVTRMSDSSLMCFVCSSLSSQAEIDSFFETSNVEHLALIFEEAQSYIGREVTAHVSINLSCVFPSSPEFYFFSGHQKRRAYKNTQYNFCPSMYHHLMAELTT